MMLLGAGRVHVDVAPLTFGAATLPTTSAVVDARLVSLQAVLLLARQIHVDTT